jgi:hypothetical protein
MIEKFLKNMTIIGIILFIIFFAYVSSFFSPGSFREYDKPTLIFLISMYVVFYIINYFLENRLTAEQLAGKDLVFLSLKFLIQIFYAAIMAYTIADMRDKKDFLIHFLIYAVLFFILDTIIYYQMIKKNG